MASFNVALEKLLQKEGGWCNVQGDSGGETYAMKLLISVAKETRELNPDIRFHLFSGDIADVCERLDKGLIDFGLVIEPADLSKYEFLRLPVSDTWGVLLRKDNPLALKKSVTPDDLRSVPVIISKHALNRSNVTEWFGSGGIPDIVSTYNLLYNASFLAEEGVRPGDGRLDRPQNDSRFLARLQADENPPVCEMGLVLDPLGPCQSGGDPAASSADIRRRHRSGTPGVSRIRQLFSAD